jgi:hypothetical protein
MKAGSLSTYNNITGTGGVTGPILAVKLAEASISGSGDITAFGGLVVQLIAAITGTGTISDADLKAFLQMAANITGSGDITANLTAIADLIADILGSGDITSLLTGTGAMSADLVVTGTGLTTSNVGQAVWAAIASANNTAGTMGEKLNDAGSAGNPWAAFLAANNDPNTFGKLIQDMEILVDELHKIQGLNATAPMTVTPSSREAGAISLTLTGDGFRRCKRWVFSFSGYCSVN